MHDDPLGVVLAGLRLSGALYYRSEVGGEWGVDVPTSARAHFHVLEAGRAIVDVAGLGTVELGAGDLILFPRGDEHRMSSSRAARCTPLARVLELAAARGWSLRVGEPPLSRMLCGYVDVGAGPTHPLVRALPAAMHLRAPLDDACTAIVAALSHEAARSRPGATALVTRLCEALFCHVVSAWYEREESRAGWLSALGDSALAPALTAMHRRLAHPWTVDELAREAALSRAAFAKRFVSVVGEPPLHYLTHARMQAAAELLRNSDATLDAIATAVGYASTEAFSRGFRRIIGAPPGSFRRASGSATPTSVAVMASARPGAEPEPHDPTIHLRRRAGRRDRVRRVARGRRRRHVER
jgi:AraC-like DNA-binding protein